jgi:hypothetical protein
MKHACISPYVSVYGEQIDEKTDEEIMTDIRRSSLPRGNSQWWYMHEVPGHRLYLRLLHQEAHRRGLEPKKGGT